MTNLMSIFFICFAFEIAQLQGGLFHLITNKPTKEYTSTKIRFQSQLIELAIVMIFQDEAPYLKEWIEYHKLLGVKRFYLYNHDSRDNYLSVLKPYIKKGIVKLVQWNKTNYDGHDLSSWNAVQCLAYMNALEIARTHNVKWLAIIDSDEFLVPLQRDSLVDFLTDYENETIGSLSVNWVMFGTSYVKKIPSDKLLIETLILNQGYTFAGSKVIVRPERCNPNIMGGPHNQPLLPNYESLSIPFDVLQCNHYWSRDESYLNDVKIPRRIRWGTPPEACLEWTTSFNEETSAGEPILRFIPELREKMGLDS